MIRRVFLGCVILLTIHACDTGDQAPSYDIKEEKLVDQSAEVDVEIESPSQRPQNVTAPPLPEVVTFAGDTIPLYRDDVREALEYELTVNTFLHSKTMNIIKKFERWRPLIEQELEENQIPRDFIYLAVAESELDNNALSPVGAMGMWQFMKGTAKDYGLEIDRSVDMRRDPKLSTEAASKYLLEAYADLKDWPLVAASYNRGMRGIKDLLEEQKTDNFFDLHLNEETSRYLYRILALKLILENPKAYGYFIKPEEKYKPYEYDIVKVDKDIDDLVDFAQKYGTTYKELRILNPWFNNTTNYKLNVPRNESYELRVPVNPVGSSAASLSANSAAVH